MRAALSRTTSVIAVVAAAVPTAAVPTAAPAVEPGDGADRGDDVRELRGAVAAAAARPLRPDPPGGEAGARQAGPSSAFPIDGVHTYGDGFGDRPDHRGADVLAACGTPLRAVKDGTVRHVASEGGAGRYIVLHDAGSGADYVYMHMSEVDVATGDRVSAGRRVGSVGQTGNATTCHLHFEAWSAPGWYAGGSPHDPMPLLRSLGAA